MPWYPKWEPSRRGEINPYKLRADLRSAAAHINRNISGADIADPFQPNRDLDIDGHQVLNARNTPGHRIINASGVLPASDNDGSGLRALLDGLRTARARAIIYFRPGLYTYRAITETIRVPAGVMIMGGGHDATRIEVGGGTNIGSSAIFSFEGAEYPGAPDISGMKNLTIFQTTNMVGPPPDVIIQSSAGYGMSLSDIIILGPAKTAIRFVGSNSVAMRHVVVHAHRDNATYVDRGEDWPGIEIKGGSFHQLRDVQVFHVGGTAINIENVGNSQVINPIIAWDNDSNLFWEPDDDGHGFNAIRAQTCNGLGIIGGQVQSAMHHALIMEDCVNSCVSCFNALGWAKAWRWLQTPVGQLPYLVGDTEGYKYIGGIVLDSCQDITLEYNHLHSVSYEVVDGWMDPEHRYVSPEEIWIMGSTDGTKLIGNCGNIRNDGTNTKPSTTVAPSRWEDANQQVTL